VSVRVRVIYVQIYGIQRHRRSDSLTGGVEHKVHAEILFFSFLYNR
jgi:hypothetical protein